MTNSNPKLYMKQKVMHNLQSILCKNCKQEIRTCYNADHHDLRHSDTGLHQCVKLLDTKAEDSK